MFLISKSYRNKENNVRINSNIYGWVNNKKKKTVAQTVYDEQGARDFIMRNKCTCNYDGKSFIFNDAPE